MARNIEAHRDMRIFVQRYCALHPSCTIPKEPVGSDAGRSPLEARPDEKLYAAASNRARPPRGREANPMAAIGVTGDWWKTPVRVSLWPPPISTEV